MRRPLGLLVFFALACVPDPAPLPPADLVGPPDPAAFDCSPPYARFGNGSFVWVDMDRGVSCEVFLEQDECVLGVFRDCTAPFGIEQEWQGSIDGDARIQIDALFPDPRADPPRRPRCCVGPLVRPDGGPVWSRLTCRLTDCDNPNDRSHVGLYFEELVPRRPSGTAAPIAPGPGTVIDAANDLVLIGGTGPSAGVWRISSSDEQVFPVENGQALAAREDAIWVLTEQHLLGPRGLQVELSETPVALAASTEGVVVALERMLLAFVQTSTVPVATAAIANGARAADLVENPAGIVWLLTQEPSGISELGFSLQMETPTSLEGQILGPPQEPVWIEDQLAFVGRCHSAAAVDHCLYMVDPQSKEVDRIGLTDGSGLGRPEGGPRGRWWVPDRSGLVHVVSPGERRPILAERFELSEGSRLLVRSEPDRWRAFSRTGSGQWTVEPAPGME